MHHSHPAVIRSIVLAINPLGICNNSVKKSRLEQNKNAVKTGPNTRLPIGDSIDIGRPHHIRMGSDNKVRKSCKVKNLSIQLDTTGILRVIIFFIVAIFGAPVLQRLALLIPNILSYS
jgi:hypothetical protein